MPDVDVGKVLEEAYVEELKDELRAKIKKPKKDYGKLMERIAESVMGMYGVGVLVNTLFTVGSGTAITNINQVIGGPLVMVFLALGFGLGFARGYRDAIEVE